jgi:hypothetical protein
LRFPHGEIICFSFPHMQGLHRISFASLEGRSRQAVLQKRASTT